MYKHQLTHRIINLFRIGKGVGVTVRVPHKYPKWEVVQALGRNSYYRFLRKEPQQLSRAVYLRPALRLPQRNRKAV
jgi:hypothetical protein